MEYKKQKRESGNVRVYYSLKRNRFVVVVGPALAGLWPLRSSTDSRAVMHYITVLIFVRAMNKSDILGSFLDKIKNRHNNICVYGQTCSKCKDQPGKVAKILFVVS